MASDNQIRPIETQLKQKFSSSERTQINSLKNLGGGLPSKAGGITSSVSQQVSNIDARQKSAMEMGANLAKKLESAGAYPKTAERVIAPAVTSTVYDKIPLAEKRGDRVLNKRINVRPKNPRKQIQNTKDRIVGQQDLRYAGLEFPTTLTSEAASYVYLHFQIYDRSQPESGGIFAPGDKIFLPIPENLSTGFNMRFEERDTGALGDLANSDAARNAIDTFGQNGSVGEALSGIKVGEAQDAIRAVAQRSIFAGLNSVSETLGGIASQNAGIVNNPLPTAFFKGMDLRSFTWTWKLVPKSSEDASAIKSILKTLRQNVLPEKVQGDTTYLKYPNMVWPHVLEAGGASNLDLYGKFKKSSVKELLINYTAEGTSAYFVDGHPVAINLQITFQEIEAYTKEDA